MYAFVLIQSAPSIIRRGGILALEYAFLQMNRPSKWKFNKARQNWLIRNVWNPEAVSLF